MAASRSEQLSELLRARTAVAGVAMSAASTSSRTSANTPCKRADKQPLSNDSPSCWLGASPRSRRTSRTASRSSAPGALPTLSSMAASAGGTSSGATACNWRRNSSVTSARAAPSRDNRRTARAKAAAAWGAAADGCGSPCSTPVPVPASFELKPNLTFDWDGFHWYEPKSTAWVHKAMTKIAISAWRPITASNTAATSAGAMGENEKVH
mmetsp:Transcript_49210/g.136750  ORF Transcript_49210/g.136750 Transcript_49210/m.136750 type:complete len:210 (-) Transcript_49210:79-708(-)